MSDVEWFTYADLAAVLGIGGDSARNLTRRRRWPRQPGNDGLARVGVPVEYLAEHAKTDPPADRPIEPPTSLPADGGITEVVAVLTRHVERLESELREVKAERDQATIRAASVDALQAILEIERRHAAEVKVDRDAWRGQVERLATRSSWWPFRRSG